MLTTFDELRQAIALFASILSRKLREQQSAAVSLSVFIHTNAFRKDMEQYFNSAHRQLPEATSDTLALTTIATEALRAVYRKGYSYKKAGILVHEVVHQSAVQPSLFADPADRARRSRLMDVLDNLNSSSIGHDRVHLAAYLPVDSLVKSERRSPMYTTRFQDIITVR